jgi:hypothetical protein
MAPETAIWERISVFVVGVLVLIPGAYFGAMIIMIECGVRGYSYNLLPE